MSFLSILALATALLVVAPYLAHRLRRKRADERPFAPARLVAPAPPKARRRSKLEDRALFATRALAIAALAVLGATPLVRCTRLSLQRSGGASVALALVVDDSMSMRAPLPGSSGTGSRFDRARKGALELLASAREGDAVAVVLAGAAPRVALAATTDLTAARAVVEALRPGDRATDLEGAVAMARGLVESMPQFDRRVVVLSDLADGHPDAPPLGEGGNVPVWVALPELRGDAIDCAVLTADRAGDRVRARVTCNGDSAGREVQLRDGEKVLARAPLSFGAPARPVGERTIEVSLVLPADADKPGGPPTGSTGLVVALSGADAVASDDSARVVTESGPGAVAVVADTAEESAATGGAPVVEQALAALGEDVAVRPIPILPERVEDLAPFRGILLDDPPGFTPEQRHALSAFLEQGGVVLLALGPHAASAPLGASLEPVLSHAVGWVPGSVRGADPASGAGPFGESAASLEDLGAAKRAVLAPEDARAFEPLIRWKDGAPLVARRAIGRGEAWIVTLPFALEQSDLSLRPAFLALLDGWVDEAHARMAQRRSEVGTVWTFPGAATVRGPAGPVEPIRGDGASRLSPSLIGVYEVSFDGKSEIRVATPVLRELDFRPRAVTPQALAGAMGEKRAAVDVSWVAALVLLGLMTVELALRVGARLTAASANASDDLRKHGVFDEAPGP